MKFILLCGGKGTRMDDPVFEAVTACCILKTFFYFSKTEPILPIYKTLGKMRLFSSLV